MKIVVDQEIDIDALIERRNNPESDQTTTEETSSSWDMSNRTDIENGAPISKEGGELVIEWSNVKCTYPAKGKEEEKTTLFNASGCLKTRELTAIMGPRYVGIFLLHIALVAYRIQILTLIVNTK